MAAYVISELSHINSEHVADYLAAARPSVEPYGGRYLTSTTDISMLEGNNPPVRYVIVEFPSKELAAAWYSSAEYKAALAHRDKALVRRLMLVNGE